MAKKSILILEEDPTKGAELVSALESEGYSCVLTHNAPEAMKSILLYYSKLVAVFINMKAAPLGCVELCNSIRSLEELKHIPIILVADDPSPEDFIVGLDAGCIDVVTYPVNMQQLNARLSQAVSFWTLFRKQQKKAVNAQAVAQDSMEYSNYLADIVSLSDKCARLKTYDALADAVFAITNKRALNASVIFLGGHHDYYYSSTAQANPLEKEMMLLLYGSAGGGESGNRFKIFNNRVFACFEQSILLIKNGTPETVGHLQDLMASLMNVVDTKAKSMDQERLRKEELRFERLKNLKAFYSAFYRIEDIFNQQTESIKNKVFFIESELSVNLAALDLGDHMEREITNLVVGYFSQVVGQVQHNREHLKDILFQITEFLEQELNPEQIDMDLDDL